VLLQGDRLALRTQQQGSPSLGIKNLRDDSGQALSLDVERLGFSEGQIDQPRLKTLQDLEQMLREGLQAVAPHLADGFGLSFDIQAGIITTELGFFGERSLDSTPLSLPVELAGLTDLQSESEVDLLRRVEGSFVLGIDLLPIGSGFEIDDSTMLDTLPGWGSGFEREGLEAHLAITLSDGDEVLVDLSDAETIGQVRLAIEEASRISPELPNRLQVSLSDSQQGLTVTDLTFDPDGDSAAQFEIAAANDSQAAFILGIFGQDINQQGSITGTQSSRPVANGSFVHRRFRGYRPGVSHRTVHRWIGPIRIC
jgi:hypothetical protein